MSALSPERALNAEVSREVARIQREHAHVVPRAKRGRKCRVCDDPDARRRINTMLSRGMRPGEIVENIVDINARRAKNNQITYGSIRDHRQNHFNIQEPTKAAYLRMLERHAAQEDANLLAEGVGSQLTLRGYLAIVADKGFQELIKDDQHVGYTVGLDAMRELEMLAKADRDEAERAKLRADVALLQQAVREEFTPEEMRRLSHRIDVLRGVINEDDDDEEIEGEVVDDEEDDGEYGEDWDKAADFVMEPDEDDPLGDD